MARQPNAVDRLMAEYIVWGGPILTRADAVADARRDGFTDEEIGYIVFARPAVPAPEDPEWHREWHRKSRQQEDSR